MRIHLLVLGLLVALLPSAAAAQPAPSGDRLQVLYFTHMAGFKHDVVPFSEEVMKSLGQKRGWDVTVTREPSVFEPASLSKFDVVVFNTTGELPLSETQKAAFLDFVRSGKGFVGIHSATDTFYKWAEYGEMIGGYFDGHPWNEEVGVKVEDRSHPATKHLPAEFTIADEIYQHKDWSRADVHVLISLDTSKTDMTKKGIKRADKDFGLAWTRTFGKGRVFYTAFGHRDTVWKDARFLDHLAGGIEWTAGRALASGSSAGGR